MVVGYQRPRSFPRGALYPSTERQCSRALHSLTAAVVPDVESSRRRKRDTSAPLPGRREALVEEGKMNLLVHPLISRPQTPEPARWAAERSQRGYGKRPAPGRTERSGET